MKFKYQLDEKLSPFPLLMYGLQWFLVSIPMVLIIGAIVSNIQGFDLASQTLYTQKLLGVMGIGLITQVLFGHKLPVVIGPASVLLIGILAAGASNASQINTAILIGGALLFIVYASNLLSKIQFIFTTRIVIVIMALIAFTLAPVIIDLIFEQGNALFSLSFAIGTVLLMTLANTLLKGVWNSIVVLLALIIGTAVYYFAMGAPVKDMSAATNTMSSFFAFPLKFDWGITLSFVFCYIALLVNQLGSVQSVGQALGAKNMDKRGARSVGVAGLLNMASGSMGIIGPVDFSLSLGLINATGCASRFALIPAGVGLLACAFFPAAIDLLDRIPHMVMGSILLYIMSSQLSASFQMVANSKAVKNFNHGIIISMPLMIAILVAFMPKELSNEIPALIRPIVANGFVMGVLSVLILEHLVFRKKKDKSVVNKE